jgi:hypothetical protein
MDIKFLPKNTIELCLPPAFTPVSCLAYFFTLKLEAICSSETLVDFQWATWHYIPEDSTVKLYIYRMEQQNNQNSNITCSVTDNAGYTINKQMVLYMS